jgi:hypothetical protein
VQTQVYIASLASLYIDLADKHSRNIILH